MAKINTDLNTNVQLENAPTPEAVAVGSGSQIIGKSGFEQLADTLASINPAIRALADKDLKAKNEASANEGAAKINGMTLEESKLAHKNGFPDIYNGWARFGAYKQYANNSADKFIQDFKQDYWAQRNTPNYNWQDHYSQFSEQYLAGKGDDEFFASAYNESTAKLRTWLNTKEFERQQDNLVTKIRQNTSYNLQALPHKVEEELEIAFYEDELLEEGDGMSMNVKDYAERKQKYFAENAEKMFEKLYYDVKNNKNPALDNVDFDEILIQEAKTHALIDGRFSNSYIKFLTQNKPDGTPSTLNNPKFAPTVRQIVKDLQGSNDLFNYAVNWSKGNVAASYSKADRKKFDNQMFDREVAARTSTGATPAKAFLDTVVSLEQGMQLNEPIGRIEDLFSKPLSSFTTEDSKLALEVYARLDQSGLTGIYFKENDKSKYDFFIANAMVQSGMDYRDVIREIGTKKYRTSEIITLNSQDRKDLQNYAVNSSYAPNQELTQMVGEYFKNTMPEGANYIKATGEFIDKNYTDINGRLISNYKIKKIGVTPENYDVFKINAIELLKEKLNTEKDVIEDSELIGFFFDETNPNIEGDAPNINRGIDLNNYEIIVNDERNTIMFKENLSTSHDVPATVEYKDGQAAWLEIPIDIVKSRVLEKARIQKIKDDAIAEELRIQKDTREEEAEKFNRQTESMVP